MIQWLRHLQPTWQGWAHSSKATTVQKSLFLMKGWEHESNARVAQYTVSNLLAAQRGQQTVEKGLPPQRALPADSA